MVSLELNQNIKIDTEVILGVKPTNIILSKTYFTNISCKNQIKATITNIEKGEIVALITLQVHNTVLESIILVDVCNKLELNYFDDVVLLIKESDLYITTY